MHNEEAHNRSSEVSVCCPGVAVILEEEAEHTLSVQEQQPNNATPHVRILEQRLTLHDEGDHAADRTQREEQRHAQRQLHRKCPSDQVRTTMAACAKVFAQRAGPKKKEIVVMTYSD